MKQRHDPTAAELGIEQDKVTEILVEADLTERCPQRRGRHPGVHLQPALSEPAICAAADATATSSHAAPAAPTRQTDVIT